MTKHTTRTAQYGPINGEEAILERLLKVLLLERLLLGDDIVQVFARVQRNLVASVAIVDTKEGYSDICVGGLELFIALECLQVEDGGVGVFHADSPTLHGADAEDDSIILAFVRVLCRSKRQGQPMARYSPPVVSLHRVVACEKSSIQ